MTEKERPYIRLYCAPCGQTITLPEDGMQAWQHANAHGTVLEYTDEDGTYIGHPRPEHTPTPAITVDEVIDIHDMPLALLAAFFRETMRQAVR